MTPLPSPIIQVMQHFASAFTQPTYAHVLLLVRGAILAPGVRTVAAALRVSGQGANRHFSTYHRVLNRAAWSPWWLSQLLLGLLVSLFLAPDAPLVLLIDETIERRRGEAIVYKSWFRDPVRSTGRHLCTVLGIRWVCLALLVPVPWSARPWALPFLTVPALSKEVSARLHQRQRTVVEWAILLITKVRRWQPQRHLVLVGDGSYCAVELVRTCQALTPAVSFVSRLRLDARLHAPPQRTSKCGPTPKKGPRLTPLSEQLSAADTPWQAAELIWYSGTVKAAEWTCGSGLWAKAGSDPVPLTWVLVRAPDDPHFKAAAFCCSDLTWTPSAIVTAVIARWNLEVTFAELRRHLGFETQRHWSRRALERTTPALFGLFTLVVVFAKTLHPQQLPMRQTAWYTKTQPTFADALAAVRAHLWQADIPFTSSATPMSSADDDLCLFPTDLLAALKEIACYST